MVSCRLMWATLLRETENQAFRAVGSPFQPPNLQLSTNRIFFNTLSGNFLLRIALYMAGREILLSPGPYVEWLRPGNRPESLVAGLETLAGFRVAFPFWNKVVSDGRAKRLRPAALPVRWVSSPQAGSGESLTKIVAKAYNPSKAFLFNCLHCLRLKRQRTRPLV